MGISSTVASFPIPFRGASQHAWMLDLHQFAQLAIAQAIKCDETYTARAARSAGDLRVVDAVAGFEVEDVQAVDVDDEVERAPPPRAGLPPAHPRQPGPTPA